MFVSKLTLKNWRNFREVDVALSRRMFIVGNNGLGKSNLLDAFRFLHDIAKEKGGGLQDAVDQRGGMGRLRSLFAARNPEVQIGVEVRENEEDAAKDVWHYLLEIRQQTHGKTPRQIYVAKEVVKKGEETILNRTCEKDSDNLRKFTQTVLEQNESNEGFLPLVEFFRKIEYQHIVPQLIRNAPALQAQTLPDDPYGQDLFNDMARLTEAQRKSRLRSIENAMQKIKSEFSGFVFRRDDKTGQPHLEYRHDNWRSRGTIQNEQQLSDGELRLVGLLWALLRPNQMLLLEEPEISFNEGIVRILPRLFGKLVLRHKKRKMSQILISTHSEALLNDGGIAADEVILLQSGDKGTDVVLPEDVPHIMDQLRAGLTPADSVLPRAQIQSPVSLPFPDY